MKTKEIKKWLQDIDDDEDNLVYIQTKEKNLISPNMGYALIDEIFAWQDKLDDIEYSNQGLIDLYFLTEEILSELESRLEIDSDLIDKIEKISEKEYVKLDIPDQSFFDYVNNYAKAKKVGEVVQSCALLIYYVQRRLPYAQCDIHNDRLWIKRKDNSSCSTSIISNALQIKASNIDDKDWEEGVWSIQLYKR